MPPTKRNLMGGVDISLPNVSYCKDVKDVHYNPYNTVEFYVGEITGTTPQTVKIYTDSSTSVDVTVSEGNKWYSYVLPKDKGLYNIEGSSVKKVVVKANISFESSAAYPYFGIIPNSTVEASFKGSNTIGLTIMRNMFCFCRGLTSLDVSNFDTSKITNMSFMFYNCSGLNSLDVSSFDTSKVTDMNAMFHGCIVLTSLDVSNFNTSNVTDMTEMFFNCNSITSLDVSNFDTSNVTDMKYMFSGCSGLTSLDLSNFNTSNVTDMKYMFQFCSKLKTITMKDCSEATRTKIQEQLTKDNITGVTFVTK